MRAPVDFTDPLLEVFVDTFLGYGTFMAPLWFVGPFVTSVAREQEDGGRTILAWHRRGHRELEDLRDFHLAAGESTWFDPKPRLHRIWGKLSRLALSYANRVTSDYDVRHFQATELGSRSGETCMLYLYPTAHDSHARPHATGSGVDTRRARLDSKWSSRRRNMIRMKIRKHRPDVVIFYDVSHRQAWQSIAESSFAPSHLPQCMHAAGPNTEYLMLRHPESIGITNEYFEKAGQLAAHRPKRRPTTAR